MKLKKMWLNINGADRMFICNPERESLADVLRRLGLTGVKVGCGTGVCGACSVILNGEVVRTCMRKISSVAENSKVTTIEGIGTPNNLHPLQQAWITYGGVQCGFCSPGFIVSAKALLDQNINPTREDVRQWFQKHRNICRCTGYKPLVDAVMAAARVLRGEATMEDISFRDPADKEYFGKPVPRPAALAKVCGLSDYGDDISIKMPPGTLHIAIIQPKKYHHAKILGIDTSEAENMPGVVKVITAKDVKGTNHLASFNNHKRSTVRDPSHPILNDVKIFRWGDVVGLVVADTRDNARAAAAAVKVDLEPLPEYLNFIDAAMPDAIRVHDDTPNIFVKQPVLKGDFESVPEIIDNADYAVEGSFYSTREPHLSIEGDVVQAYWGEDDVMTIQCKAQAIYGAISSMAGGIGLPTNKIRIIENPTGGSFGWSTAARSYALTAIAVMETGVPCSLSMSYEEHQHFSGKRCPSHTNVRLACDKDGKFTAVEFDVGVDHGAFSEGGEGLITRFIRYMCFPYYVPNVMGLARVANTNHNFGAAYRGFGSPQIMTASEGIIDMLSYKYGVDPFDFRYINIARKGQTNNNSYPYREYPMEEIMDKARPIYERMKKLAAEESTDDKPRAVGVAWGAYNVSGSPTDSASVAVSIDEGDTFTNYNTWEDVGQGGDVGTVMFMLKALKPLGVTPDRIKLVMNDSGECPNTGISGASRQNFMAGNATKLAVDKLLDAMKKPDGTYRTYAEMVAEGIPTKYDATYENTAVKGLCDYDADRGIGDPIPTYAYGLFLADVEVDKATGKTTVKNYSVVCDCGVVANPISVEGQAYGGISHTIGFALSENYDDVVRHANMAGAGIPQILDIPDNIELVFCENPRDLGPFGSSGCSEMFQSGGHMAVINGIYRACGVRIFELPALPAKVKAGLEKIAAGLPGDESPKKYYLGPDFYDEIEDIIANPVEDGTATGPLHAE